MTTIFQKLHITSRRISAYLLQCSQMPINTLFSSSQIRKCTKLIINYATAIQSMQILFMSMGLIFTSYTEVEMYGYKGHTCSIGLVNTHY